MNRNRKRKFPLFWEELITMSKYRIWLYTSYRLIKMVNSAGFHPIVLTSIYRDIFFPRNSLNFPSTYSPMVTTRRAPSLEILNNPRFILGYLLEVKHDNYLFQNKKHLFLRFSKYFLNLLFPPLPFVNEFLPIVLLLSTRRKII